MTYPVPGWFGVDEALDARIAHLAATCRGGRAEEVSSGTGFGIRDLVFTCDAEAGGRAPLRGATDGQWPRRVRAQVYPAA